MATVRKVFLSESDGGRPILSTATVSPGTLIHTAISEAGGLDEVFVFVCNTDATREVKVTVEFGGTNAPDDTFICFLPAQSGLFPLVQGIPLAGGLSVAVFTDLGSSVTVAGYVNRVTEV